jgi:hypothetical protein
MAGTPETPKNGAPGLPENGSPKSSGSSPDLPDALRKDMSRPDSLRKLKEQKVRLGQFFSAFPKGFTHRITFPGQPLAQYDSYTTLVAPTGDHVRFLITANSDFREVANVVVAPFRPETGYRIDEHDFDEIAGPYKYRQWRRSFDKERTDSLPFFLLHTGFHEDDYDPDPPVSEGTYEFLDRLQLQVVANSSIYQSDVSKRDLPDDNKLEFDTFYPFKYGPLPYAPDGGFQLWLPDDIDKLRTVQARFVLPQEKPNVPSGR